MDKPYVERTGGAYEADVKTGTLKRTEPELKLSEIEAGDTQSTPATEPVAALPDPASGKSKAKGE